MRNIAFVLAVSFGSAGCYQYLPVAETAPLPEPGTDVRAMLSPVKSFNLGSMTINDISIVEGSVYTGQNDSLAVWTDWVHSQFGNRYPANGSVFYVPRGEIVRLEARSFSAPKTAVAATIGVAALIGIFELVRRAGGGAGIDEPPDPPFRISLPLGGLR